jgi:hypothetical protein
VVRNLMEEKSNNFRLQIGGQKFWQEKVLNQL